MNQQQLAVVQQALEALEDMRIVDFQLEDLVNWNKAARALRQLLEQPEPVHEPVAWMYEDMMGLVGVRVQKEKPIVARPVTPLYTAPPASGEIK